MNSDSAPSIRPRQTTTFQDSFSEEVWRSTYKDHNDTDINDTFWRVATAIASVEETEELRAAWAKHFYDMMSDFKVVPGGRILANAGTEFKGTSLINCFVSPHPTRDVDSLEGILETLHNQSLTLKSEGGWGHNFSSIRPRGSFINGIGVETPGAVKFMELFDKSSEIITAGSGTKSTNKKAKGKIRKGAMMAVMNCWHPDVIEFITAKQHSNRLSKFNVSVNCTDEFMEKVLQVEQLKKSNAPSEEIDAITWDLVFPDTTYSKYKTQWFGDLQDWKSKGYPVVIHKTVQVEWLWNLITQSTYNRNEPGILFLDRSNKFNQLNYAEKIASTNPCITGDTLVAVADGRDHVTISQLALEDKDVPVYCYNNSGKLDIRMMRNPRITGYQEPIYKITLDDGNSIRTTQNHKFRLTDGSYKEVKDLVAGDSLKLLVKYQVSMKEVFEKANSVSQDYWWMNTGKATNIAEHQLIASFHNNCELKTGMVVHHKDYQGLNNNPDNLQIMTKQDHDNFHSKDMIGDKNPMRRAITEWSKEKWEQYQKNREGCTGGEKNSNYSGITNEELREAALVLTKKLGYRFSTADWVKYARENQLPEQFSKWRNDHLDGLLGLSKWAALECGYENIDCSPKILRNLKRFLENGYHCSISDNTIIFHKNCEFCSLSFDTSVRERAFCSLNCSSQSKAANVSVQQKIRETFAKSIASRHTSLRNKQSKIYSDLKFKLERHPLKKEWMKECRTLGVSAEICRKSSPYKTFEELKNVAADYNHKVVSVEFVGYEDVYNGTVDEFHNFCVGGFESKTASGKIKYSYINNLQCGEQMLAPGGICCLGTLNLTQFVKEDLSGFDLNKIRKYAGFLVRFLDNVNSYSDAPLPEYVHSMRNKRRIGCGLMGWGSALFMLHVRFGSERASELRKEVLRAFTHAGVKASIDLAEEKGRFSLCDPLKHEQSPFWDNIELSKDLRERMKTVGIRNSSLFSMQPNGNSGVLANVVSGGIEPIFLPQYIRTVIQSVTPEHIASVTPNWAQGEWKETEMFKFAQEGDEQILRGVDKNGTVYKIDRNRGLTKEVLCQDYGVRFLAAQGKWKPNADWAVTTNNLTVAEHVGDLQGFAKMVDSACSKTVNLPSDYSFNDFQTIYLDAYKTGFIKGLTTYRAGSMTAVLSAVDQKNDVQDEEVILTDVKMPDSSKAEVKVLRDYEGGTRRKWYVTVTCNENNAPIGLFVQTNALEKTVLANDAVDHLIALARAKGIPEQFVTGTIEKCHNDSNSTKIARAIGLLLRHGVRIKNIVATLDKIDGVTFSSFVFHLKKLLSTYIKDGEKVEGATCTNCGSGQIVYESGCSKCLQCGGSKCS